MVSEERGMGFRGWETGAEEKSAAQPLLADGKAVNEVIFSFSDVQMRQC